MEDKEKCGNCPDSVILEDYRDGVASSEWVEHIDRCEHCQRRVASLDLLDLRIRKVCEPPNGMADRIKAAVHEGREPSNNPVPFWRRGWLKGATSVAAMLVLLSVSLYIINNKSDDESAYRQGAGMAIAPVPQQQAPEANMQSEDTIIASATAKNNADEKVLLSKARLSENSGHSSLHIPTSGAYLFNSNLRLAGTQADRVTERGQRVSQHVSIGESVRHIWGVKDAKKAYDIIMEVATANDKKVETSKSAGNIRVVMYLHDDELQALVDLLNTQGWKLLSPYMPQPGRKDEVEFHGSPVAYYMDIVAD